MAHSLMNTCQKCNKGAYGGLFKDGDLMVCCKCKYGSPLTPAGYSPQTLFSSQPQPPNLDTYDRMSYKK